MMAQKRKHLPGVFSTFELSAVRDNPPLNEPVEDLEWDVVTPGAASGHQTVILHGLLEDENARCRIFFNARRPHKVSFQFIGRDVPLCRIDVNDFHRGIGTSPHIHRYRPDGREDTSALPDMATRWGNVLDLRPHLKVIACEALRIMNIDYSKVVWCDPPEGEDDGC